MQTRRSDTDRPSTTQTHTSTPVPAVHDADLVDDMDTFLDEIDAILEDNALETVRMYVQRSGQ